MDNVLTVHQISSKVVDIIEEAKEYCFLITPYYKPWEILTRTLLKAKTQGKKIVFILRKDSTSDDQINYLSHEMGFDLVLVDRLHSKLYMNEQTALISSMNLYDSSKEYNYEIGFVIQGWGNIKRIKDRIIDNDILLSPSIKIYKGRYFDNTSSSENTINLGQNKKQIQKEHTTQFNIAYCIRCKKIIEKNTDAPLCDECYSVWAQFMNLDYLENYCHRCGKKTEVTKRDPYCASCKKAEKR